MVSFETEREGRRREREGRRREREVHERELKPRKKWKRKVESRLKTSHAWKSQKNESLSIQTSRLFSHFKKLHQILNFLQEQRGRFDQQEFHPLLRSKKREQETVSLQWQPFHPLQPPKQIGQRENVSL